MNENDKDDMPEFLKRKGKDTTPATLEERQAYAAKSAPVEPTKPHVETSDERVLREIAEKDAQTKKVKAHNRIARLKDKKALDAIPEKFRAWDARNARWYDKRNPKVTAKETTMSLQTTTTKKATSAQPAKKTTRKAAPKKAAVKSNDKATLTSQVIKLAQRAQGVSPAELNELTKWKGAPWKWNFQNPKKTGYADKLGLKFKVEKVNGETRYKLSK